MSDGSHHGHGVRLDSTLDTRWHVCGNVGRSTVTLSPRFAVRLLASAKPWSGLLIVEVNMHGAVRFCVCWHKSCVLVSPSLSALSHLCFFKQLVRLFLPLRGVSLVILHALLLAESDPVTDGLGM